MGLRSDDLCFSPSCALILLLSGRGDCYIVSGFSEACDGWIVAGCRSIAVVSFDLGIECQFSFPECAGAGPLSPARIRDLFRDHP